MSDADYPIGGDAVVHAVRSAGVRTVFGVVSVHNLPIFDALRRSDVRLIPTRSEPSALNMADGYARAGGGIGVAITSTGTGAANAAGASVEALAAGSRVLHLTGQIETRYLGRGCGYIHETKDQLAMLEAVSKRALRAQQGAVGTTVAEGLQEVIEFPQGPVSVEIPIDLQHAQAELVEVSLRPPRRLSPDVESVRRAARLIKGARRPVIWAGGGVVSSDAGEALREILERMGAALVTSNQGRGSVPEDHPQCIGNFGNQPVLQPFLEKADLLLSIGTHFRSNESLTYGLPIPDTHIQIDIDASAIGRSIRAGLGIVGDARETLIALGAELDGYATTNTAYLREIEEMRRLAKANARSGLGPYESILEALIDLTTEKDILARDVTVAANTWGNRLYPIRQPNTNIFAVGGGIGQGLQMGMGAKIAMPKHRVVCVVGDGGLAVNIGEMLTARQEDIGVLVLLFDDGGYGVLRNMQESVYGRRIGVDLYTPDFEEVARAMGWTASTVKSAEDFGPALEAILDERGPCMLVIDMASVGEMAQPFTPPVAY